MIGCHRTLLPPHAVTVDVAVGGHRVTSSSVSSPFLVSSHSQSLTWVGSVLNAPINPCCPSTAFAPLRKMPFGKHDRLLPCVCSSRIKKSNWRQTARELEAVGMWWIKTWLSPVNWLEFVWRHAGNYINEIDARFGRGGQGNLSLLTLSWKLACAFVITEVTQLWYLLKQLSDFVYYAVCHPHCVRTMVVHLLACQTILIDDCMWVVLGICDSI